LTDSFAFFRGTSRTAILRALASRVSQFNSDRDAVDIQRLDAKAVNSLPYYGNREYMGTRYLDLAVGVEVAGIIPNTPEQAYYDQWTTDRVDTTAFCCPSWGKVT
jgi:hypothetical protein